MNAVKMVAKIPSTIPEYINAIGIERMPVPREALSRWVRVSLSLKPIKNVKFEIKYFTLHNSRCCMFIMSLREGVKLWCCQSIFCILPWGNFVSKTNSKKVNMNCLKLQKKSVIKFEPGIQH